MVNFGQQVDVVAQTGKDRVEEARQTPNELARTISLIVRTRLRLVPPQTLHTNGTASHGLLLQKVCHPRPHRPYARVGHAHSTVGEPRGSCGRLGTWSWTWSWSQVRRPVEVGWRVPVYLERCLQQVLYHWCAMAPHNFEFYSTDYIALMFSSYYRRLPTPSTPYQCRSQRCEPSSRP